MPGNWDRDKGDGNKKLTPMQRALLRESERKVTIRVDGKTERTTIGDVVARKLLSTAANGSPHALGHSMRTLIEAQRLKQAEIDKDIEIGGRWKQRQEDRLKKAIARGEDPDRVLPHPDDIVIDRRKGYSIRGPANEEELAQFHNFRAQRDAYLVQYLLEERIGSGVPDMTNQEQEDSGTVSTPLLFFMMLNDGLPKRFRMGRSELGMAIFKLRRLTKRELLKLAYQSWREADKPKPRGWVMPRLKNPKETIVNVSTQMHQLFWDIHDGEITSDAEIERRISGMAYSGGCLKFSAG